MVNGPEFFCLDPAGNILVTDYYNNNVTILSPSGQLIHAIGKRGYEKGSLHSPYDICISQPGTIFVVSGNVHFCLQSF